ncbi:hypothetical protein EKO27_g3006 [Xylaria grammica]|uniref:Uncharacterized protein n=1 Tax=Xylaria grammica TaxID=363999 RepID=A0A439DCF6_9PEZI|nr:hypothetical protein EKO27_g3006 [Xylaria grammica]
MAGICNLEVDRESRIDVSSFTTSPSPPCWEDLTASLDAIKSLDDYITIQTYPYAPNPGLRIDGKLTPLPLTDSSAAPLKNARGYKSVEDPNTWNLGADQFNLLNPAWPSFFELVDAKLHKLTLYEQSWGFHSQNIPPREPSKIATLLVCLPSECKGGQLRLCYANQYHTYEVNEGSPFNTTVFALPCGVGYNIEKIVSGHRLVLFYNILAMVESQDPIQLFDHQANAFHSALAQCHRQSTASSIKAYLLDHKYPLTKLALSQLKGRDLTVCEILKRSCPQHGFSIFLNYYTNMVPTDYTNSTRKNSRCLNPILTLNGIRIARHHKLSEDQLLNNSCNKTRRTEKFAEVDQLQGENYNCDTAIIICPVVYLVSYLQRSDGPDWSKIVTVVMDNLKIYSHCGGFVSDSVNALGQIFKSAVHSHRRPDMLRWAWKEKHTSLYTELVLDSMNRLGSSSVMEVVAEIINDDILKESEPDSIHWEKYFGGTVGQIVGQIQGLDFFSTSLATVQGSISADLQNSFESWKATMERHAFEKNRDWVTLHLIPALRARGETTLIKYLAQVLLSRLESDSTASDRDIAREILVETNWKAALEPVDIRLVAWRRKGFLPLLEQCLRTNLEDTVIKLLDASWTKMVTQHKGPNDFPLLQQKPRIGAFLKQLGHILNEYNFPCLNSTRDIFKLLINRYMHIGAPFFPKNHPGQSDGEFVHDVELYNKTLLTFEAPFKELRFDYVKGLLGERDYRELVMLERVTCSEGANELAALDSRDPAARGGAKGATVGALATEDERSKKRRLEN